MAKLPTPQELVASRPDFPEQDWLDVKPQFTPGSYCYPAKKETMELLHMPNPHDWDPAAEDWNLPEDWETRRGDPGIEAALFGLRNQFSCESHHDLIRCRLRQITEGRGVKEAELLPLIRKYQDPPWMHHN